MNLHTIHSSTTTISSAAVIVSSSSSSLSPPGQQPSETDRYGLERNIHNSTTKRGDGPKSQRRTTGVHRIRWLTILPFLLVIVIYSMCQSIHDTNVYTNNKSGIHTSRSTTTKSSLSLVSNEISPSFGGMGSLRNISSTLMLPTTVKDVAASLDRGIVNQRNSNSSNNNDHNNTVRLSVVWSLRNDNYRNQTRRYHIAGCVMLAQLSEFATFDRQAELLLVDWNPVAGQPRVDEILKDCDRKSTNPYVHLRTVVVPSNITQSKAVNPRQRKFLQYHSKNVGIRRADGDWILVQNVDDIHPLSLIRVLMEGHLNPNYFYRTSLSMIDFRESSQGFVHRNPNRTISLSNTSSVEDITDWLASSPEAINSMLDSRLSRSYDGFCDSIFDETNSGKYFKSKISNTKQVQQMYTAAAGDFTLATKQAWYDIGGYPEVDVGMSGVDGWILSHFYYKGYRQTLIPKPCGQVFHIDHDGHDSGIPTRTMQLEVFANCLMSKGHKGNPTNRFKDSGCIPPKRETDIEFNQVWETWPDNPYWGCMNHTLLEYKS